MSKRVALLAFLAVFSCGCAALMFSSPYDPAFASALEEYQKDTDSFFETLGTVAGTPDGRWEHFEPDYRELEVELSRITQQAAVRRGNTTLLQSLDLVRQNFATYEQLHRDGITPAEVTVVRRLIAAQVRMLIQHEQARRKEDL